MATAVKKKRVAYPAVLYEVPWGWIQPGEHWVFTLTKARRRAAERRKLGRNASLDDCLPWEHVGGGRYRSTVIEVTLDVGDIELVRTGRAERVGKEWRLVEGRSRSRWVKPPDVVLRTEDDVYRFVASRERREAA